MTELAAIVSQVLQEAGIVAVLSGGAAVSTYTDNLYQSLDLDFVTDEQISVLDSALTPLGFTKDSGRLFNHPNTDYFVEFLPGPPAIGSTILTEWASLETGFGAIQILTPSQVVMDRLAAYIHWNDQPSLDQAVMVARRHSVDWKELARWAEREGGLEQFGAFERARGRR